ncbi:unnamed protein product [Paramecium octaurelia]|uniref:Uncharacterized protein n=1 Tax=Paramecium octaurelia TaxID=43137 RepID=A0A8S1XCR3_PAROT|nr:unnamed protein product [Paramecium octaurelia]
MIFQKQIQIIQSIHHNLLKYTFKRIQNYWQQLEFQYFGCYIYPNGFKENLNEVMKKSLGLRNNDLKSIVGMHQTIITAQTVGFKEYSIAINIIRYLSIWINGIRLPFRCSDKRVSLQSQHSCFYLSITL